MRIGILSDSHGRTKITARAVSALLDSGAELLIHLGDFETEQVIDELVGHECLIVFGNCDWDIKGLTRYAEAMNVRVEHPLGRLEVDDKIVAFTHGHINHVVDQALQDGVDYLLHGHTHELRDDRLGSTRIINPGALFRASRYTVAILDPGLDALEIFEIPHP